jgi:hypothetical protein
MRYVRLACAIALAIFCGLGVLIATSDDSLESFDLHHPATLLPIVAKRLQTFRSQVRELRMSELVDAAVAAVRERIRHASPTQYPSQ